MNYNELRSTVLKDASSHQFDELGFNCITTSKIIRFVRMYDTDSPTVELSVSVAKNFKLSVKVHGVDLPSSHEIWNSNPDLVSNFKDVKLVLETLSEYRTCVGNPDKIFLNLDVPSGRKDQTSDVFRERDFGACVDNISYSETIRTYNCELLVKEKRCQFCEHFRDKTLYQEKNKSATRRSTRKFKPSAKLMEQEIQDKKKTTKRGRPKSYSTNEGDDEGDLAATKDKTSDDMPLTDEDWEEEKMHHVRKKKRVHRSKAEKSCKLCDSVFYSAAELAAHVAEEHANDRVVRTCPYCAEGFTKRWILEEHMLEHATVVPKEKASSERKKKKRKSTIDREKCTICDFETTQHFLYVRHMLKHTKLKPYGCEICEKSFTTPATLDQHMRAHTGEMRYECSHEECTAKFVRISGLKDHEISVHTKQYNFLCELCNKGFLRNSQLTAHLKRCKLYGTSKTKTFKCDTCEVVFLSNKERIMHICQNDKHKMGVEYEEAAFTNSMTSVNEIPDSATYCAVCFTAFMINEDLRKHVVEEHTQEYSFRCDKCDVDFASETALKNHSMSTHVDTTKLQWGNRLIGANRPKHRQPKGKNQKVSLTTARLSPRKNERRRNSGDILEDDELPISVELDENVADDVEEEDDLESDAENDSSRRTKTDNTYLEHKLKFTCDVCGTRCRTEFTMTAHKLSHLADDGDKPFKCPVCNDSFTDASAVREHRQKHLKEIENVEAGDSVRLLRCPLCDACFRKQFALTSHIARMHTSEKPYKCDECDASFTKPGELEHHSSIHTGVKKFLCDECDGSFRTAQSLKRHKEAQHPVPGQEAPCAICGEVFATQAQLWEHGFKHKGYPFNCDVCKTGYSRKVQYERHILGRRHANKAKELGFALPDTEGKFRHVCEICGKKFYLSYDCKRHKEMTHGEKNIQCPKCPKKFVTEAKLKHHMDAHLTAIQYVCSECGKGCTNLAKLKKHEQIHIEKKHPCPKDNCEKVFARPAQLEDHLKSHDSTKEYKCEKCNKSFDQRAMMEKHACMKQGVGSRKKWLNTHNVDSYCSLCFVVFSTEEALQEHTEVQHKSDSNDWCCKDCGIVYESVGALKKHLNVTHQRMAPVRFQCDVCGKSFDTKAGRDLHEANHADVKDVPCLQCGKMFVSERHMKRHHSDHHKERRCKICDKTFENKYAFTIHRQKDHEAMLPVECKHCRKTFMSEEYLNHHVQQASEGKTQCNYCYVCNVKTNTIRHWEAVHETGKLYKCDLCPRRFCSEDDKLFHMSSRHMGGKFLCTVCNITFRNSGSLSNHRKRRHPDQTVTFVQGNAQKINFIKQAPEDLSQNMVTKLVKMETKGAVHDTEGQSSSIQGQSSIQLISIGGQLYMQPTQTENENTTFVLQVDSNGETLSSGSQIAATDVAQVQQIMSADQTSANQAMFSAQGPTGEINYQIEDAVVDEATAHVENSPPEGGHVVVVQDDGIKSGQPRKIICYIDGDLPSNVTNDMTFIQQIIDKTGVVDNTDNSDESAANLAAQTANMDSSTLEESSSQVIQGLDSQFTNIVYSVPTTSMDSNSTTSLGLDQGATNEDQVIVITTDLPTEGYTSVNQ